MNPGTHSCPELRHLQNLLMFSSPLLRKEELMHVPLPGTEEKIPIQALSLGSEADDVPVLFFVGGIHGVERIGSQVVLAFMETLIQRLQWDQSITDGLEQLRLPGIFNPIIPHRVQRVLRRHIVLMEFLISATRAYSRWLPESD